MESIQCGSLTLGGNDQYCALILAQTISPRPPQERELQRAREDPHLRGSTRSVSNLGRVALREEVADVLSVRAGVVVPAGLLRLLRKDRAGVSPHANHMHGPDIRTCLCDVGIDVVTELYL